MPQHRKSLEEYRNEVADNKVLKFPDIAKQFLEYQNAVRIEALQLFHTQEMEAKDAEIEDKTLLLDAAKSEIERLNKEIEDLKQWEAQQ